MSMDERPTRGPDLWTAWSPLQLVLFAVLLLVVQMFWQAALFGWTGNVFVPVIGASVFAVVLPCAAVSRRHGRGLLATFDLHPNRPALLAGAIAGLLCVAPASFLAGFSARLRPPSPDYLAFLAEQLPHGTGTALVALAAVSLAAPVAEEIIFRGLLFRLAGQRWGAMRAAILTGLFFGIAHWQPWSLFGLAALGIILALLYHWTGSLLAPMAAHGAHNAVALVFLVRGRNDLAARAAAEMPEAIIEPSGGLLSGSSGLVLTAASAFLLWRLLRHLRRHGRTPMHG